MIRSLLLLPALLAGAALAADFDPVAVYKFREASFGSLASHMKALKIVATAEGAPIEEAQLHAAAIRDLAGHITVWFPKGTGPDKVPETEALPKIWEDAAGFDKAAKDLSTAATAMVAALDAKDRAKFKEAFGATGKACGSCHDGFRKPED